MQTPIRNLDALEALKAQTLAEEANWDFSLLICGGAGCISSGCAAAEQALSDALAAHRLEGRVRVAVTGCMGTCAVGPVMLVQPGNIFYVKLDAERIEEIISRHLLGGEVVEEYTFFDPAQQKHVPKLEEITFFSEQVRIALRNCGRVAHDSLAGYVARDGFFALAKALEGDGSATIETLTAAGLRGRGGAGFPVGRKWSAGRNAAGEQKYIVCNADEGDPGAFMDRSILEGDPFSIIEGMLIGGHAIGASKGFVYLRAEYPLAIERLSAAIGTARTVGLLGKQILGSSFSFDMEVRIGAGAFVCGEETALLASIEGHRGEPRQKPPFPFERGLYEKPTIINNVETFANIAPILFHGADWYRRFGTEQSVGTKVFALAGDIETAGIIEVPMGVPLGDIIYKIGGGIRGGKKFKAIQSGGPSGGCLTKAHLNTPVDYESLARLGAIMGSGGLIVMNEDTCMVDTARYFLDFIKDESCGKCLPCRTGTKRMLEILERITGGEGREGDIEMLEELACTLKDTAMCGLGQTASNPVLSTLKYFREEYETHIHDKHCTAGVCAELQTAPCRNACPANVFIPGYLALAAAGRHTDAYQLIRQENPFPAVCGRVCTHPCENHCRRGQVDEAISICGIKRFIGDYALRDEYTIPRVKSRPSTGKRVAIIGAGPSGLACAYYLAHLGHAVDVYEAESVAGGVLYWGIPAYRLPKDVLAKEIHAIEAAGVNIRLNVKIGRDITFEQLRAEHEAVYIAVGTQKSRLIGVPGETLHGVESGLAFLRRVGLGTDLSVPRRLVVVGGGSTAMDVARTAIRLGAEKVTVLYRRTIEQMPAGAEEVGEAREEGVEILPLVSPQVIIGDDDCVCGIECIRRTLGDYGKDGRRRSLEVEGSAFVIDCDGVITAVNQDVDTKFYQTTEVNVTASGALDINKFTSQTSREGIFAGGDASPWGQNVVITAIADGKRAASNIDKYLGGTGELNKGERIEIPVIEDNEVTEPHGRFPMRVLPADERKESFAEVACGFHKLDAMGEALRCLHCERR